MIPLPIRRHLADASLTGEVVVDMIMESERPSVRLEGIAFHMQGGERKADRGTIGTMVALDVRQAAYGGIDHFVEGTSGLEAGSTYRFVIDAGLRRDNAIYHGAGHVPAAVCERMFLGVRAVSGHQSLDDARVNFDLTHAAPVVASEMTQARGAIEAAVQVKVGRALPIIIVSDPHANRARQVGDFAPVTCGGPHAASTAEIARFAVRSVRRKGDTMRVGYEVAVSGERVAA